MFKYVNLNPDGLEIEDCVCRAISLASGLQYTDVRDKLWLTSKLFECEELTVCCYSNLLDKVLEYPSVDCRGLTVAEFAQRHPKGIYLVRMDMHITCIVDGVINDIWDCGERIATHAWFCSY